MSYRDNRDFDRSDGNQGRSNRRNGYSDRRNTRYNNRDRRGGRGDFGGYNLHNHGNDRRRPRTEYNNRHGRRNMRNDQANRRDENRDFRGYNERIRPPRTEIYNNRRNDKNKGDCRNSDMSDREKEKKKFVKRCTFHFSSQGCSNRTCRFSHERFNAPCPFFDSNISTGCEKGIYCQYYHSYEYFTFSPLKIDVHKEEEEEEEEVYQKKVTKKLSRSLCECPSDTIGHISNFLGTPKNAISFLFCCKDFREIAMSGNCCNNVVFIFNPKFFPRKKAAFVKILQVSLQDVVLEDKYSSCIFLKDYIPPMQNLKELRIASETFCEKGFKSSFKELTYTLKAFSSIESVNVLYVIFEIPPPAHTYLDTQEEEFLH